MRIFQGFGSTGKIGRPVAAANSLWCSVRLAVASYNLSSPATVPLQAHLFVSDPKHRKWRSRPTSAHHMCRSSHGRSSRHRLSQKQTKVLDRLYYLPKPHRRRHGPARRALFLLTLYWRFGRRSHRAAPRVRRSSRAGQCRCVAAVSILEIERKRTK